MISKTLYASKLICVATVVELMVSTSKYAEPTTAQY